MAFSQGDPGEILCEPRKTVSIIECPLRLPLTPGTWLGWRWPIEEFPEDNPATHDLSIGVKFEDGQDLTYTRSSFLPKRKVFRCPPRIRDAIETHMIIRSDPASCRC